MPITKNCEHCGASYSRSPALIGRFCSKACAYAAAKKPVSELTANYRLVYAPAHPLAPPSGTVPEHRILLWNKVGKGAQRCHWCARRITWQRGLSATAVVADHVDGNRKNNLLENLVPSCQRCNGTRSRAIQLEEQHRVLANGNRLRVETRSCVHCGGSFEVQPNSPQRGCTRYCGTILGWIKKLEAMGYEVTRG